MIGDLPQERTRPTAPFEFTAVDLFGPYQVKDDVRKRVTIKVWEVVFCCMASRAIHTELANTMSTESFLMSSYPYKRLQEMQHQVNNFWSSWSQLAGHNLFVRSKWQKNVAVGEIVWLCDQYALRGHFKLGRVVSVNPDSKCIVWDVNVRVVASSCIPEVRPATSASKHPAAKHPVSSIWRDLQSKILHRDVRRLVVLLPGEEQAGSPGGNL